MYKLLRPFSRFCTKKSEFFWNEVSPGVKNVRYAVRGIVPAMADHIKDELKSGNHSSPFIIKIILSTKLPTVISATLKSLIRNPSRSSGKSSHVSSVPNSSRISPSTPMPEKELKATSTRSLALEPIRILLGLHRSERTSLNSSPKEISVPCPQ